MVRSLAVPQRPLKTLQFNQEIELKPKEKVSFSKFFPGTQQYVVIRGTAKSPTDFDLSVDIGDGTEKTSFYLDPWHGKDSMDMMKAMRDAMQEAIQFYEKAMKLPVLKGKDNDVFTFLWDDEKPKKEKKPAAKKAATKKSK